MCLGRSLVALVLVVAGCGASTGPTTPTPTPASSSTAGRTAAPVQHAVPQLEALLPNRVGNVTLRKLSQTGDTILGKDPFSIEMKKFLTSAGKMPGDLRYAQAADASGVGLEMGAFEVPGIDGKQLRDALIESSRPGAPGLTTAAVTVRDRQLTVMRYGNGSTVYYYPHGSTVFYIGTDDEQVVAQVLSVLP